ncbi:MAG: hypothetical protein H0X36_02530 [Sphingomonadaceae bacterium]|nr:hypothetical protein [Sphingomonadaceae bacterium]
MSFPEIDLVRWRRRPPIDVNALVASSPGLCLRLRIAAPITILHAPAGFGKSCAMALEYEWLRQEGTKVTWIAGEALAASRLSLTEALLAIQHLTSGSEVAFFDDADRVGSDVLEAAVTAMMFSAEAPRLVLSARRISKLHLSRRIADGAAVMIGGDMLLWHRRRFAEIWQSTLSIGQIREIDRLAEGWPAPSQLLARWLADGHELDDGGLFLGRSLVASYIDEETLSAVPVEWLEILAATALHHEFDQSLLDRLSAEHSIRQSAILDRLSTLVSSGPGPNSCRYNPLLRLQLRARLDHLSRARRNALLRVVSDWTADRGDVVSAAHLASMAGESQRIVEFTIRAGGLSLWLAKGYDTIRSLVEVAGDALVRSEPRLQLLRCVVLLKDGRVGEADRLYREAIECLPHDPDTERDAALVRATLLIYGCRAATTEDDQLFHQLDQFDVDPTWKPLLPTIQAIRHSQQAEFGAAIAAIVEGSNHARAAGASYSLLFLHFHAAGVALAQGALDRASKALTRARRLWQTEFSDDHGAETVLSALSAQLGFERGLPQQAARHLKLSAHRLPHSEAWLDIYVAGFEPMMRLIADEHGLSAAAAAIERTHKQLKAQSLDRIANLLTGLKFCIEGEHWLYHQAASPNFDTGVSSLPPTGKLATWQEHEFGTLARAYRALAAGDTGVARRKLDDLIRFARERGLLRTLVRGLLLRTALLDRTDDSVAAQADFDEALAIARRTGLRRAFREFGGPSVANRLIALQAASGTSAVDPFLKGLVRPQLLATPRRALTKRERQVLDELATGGSDKSIARRLDVTEHAVRFHLKNVYAKLNVHDRAEAVAKLPLPTTG